MNKIQELAYCNIKKYKKHYLFVSILIFCISLLFLSYTMIFNNQYEAKKQYNQDIYGTWYYKATLLNKDEKGLIGKEAKECYHKTFRYSFLYNQGNYDDFLIGYVEEDMYEFACLKLVEGCYPSSANEIMISTAFQEKEKKNINDIITLTLENQEDYKIVGIIHNSQSFFPDIYTNKEWGISLDVYTNAPLNRNFSEYHPYDPLLHALVDNESLNHYGYPGTEVAEKLDYSTQTIVILVEALILTILILMVLNSTSYKRRNKEFALLRGIGMTNKQLFTMIVYEMIYTLSLSLLLSFIMSFVVSFIGSFVLDSIYHHFVYHIHMEQIIFYTLLLFGCILIAMFIPISSSCKTALAGSFEGEKFKKIQIRYRKLKKQTPFQLAKRELIVQKNITITLIAIFFISIIFVLSSSVKENDLIENSVQNNNQMQYSYIRSHGDDLNKYHLYQDFIDKNSFDGKVFTYSWIDLPVFINKDGDTRTYRISNNVMIIDEDIKKNCVIEGRYPNNEYEIVVPMAEFARYENLQDEDVYYENEELTVGSTFLYNNEEYTVVGRIIENEMVRLSQSFYECVYYAPSTIMVEEKTFDKWQVEHEHMYDEYGDETNDLVYDFYELRIYYDNEDEGVNVDGLLSYLLVDDDTVIERAYIIWNEEPTLLIDIKWQYLCLPILVFVILCYYLNKNDMLNNIKNISLLHLIGMTNKELYLKQFYKAIIISISCLCFSIFWIVMMNLYYSIRFIPYVEFLSVMIMIIVSSTFIYCLPLVNILKNNIFDNIKGDE